MFYSIEAVTERGARGHYCYAAKLFRLCTYLNIEVDRESLGSTEHWCQIHNFSSEKNYVNRRFKTSCLQMSPLLRVTPSFMVLGMTGLPCVSYVVPYTLCQTTEKRREILEMIMTE